MSRGEGTRIRLPAKNRNEAELIDELVASIKSCIAARDKKCSLRKCLEIAKAGFITIDEQTQPCSEGKRLADTLIRQVNYQNLIKENTLPLQGNALWHEWCKKDKEQYRIKSGGNQRLEDIKSDITVAKKVVRNKQVATSRQNSFVSSFIEITKTSNTPHETKMYMIQWLVALLDGLTSSSLGQLETQYHAKWTEIRCLQKTKKTNKDIKNRLQAELDQLSGDISDITFGLQHIMREMAQRYESVMATTELQDKRRKEVAVLPDIAAELLITGHPLEVMDGDAAHVPVVWIEAALAKLIEKLGDKKVLVISIFGLQSSGKSTLLNAMFGLQFTVSTGRCTRGAFLQLLKVKSDARTQLSYEYVAIIDTEGLRSPELSSNSTMTHDNELATFIIGLGDVTVINIMGENAIETQEILQICVHTFLRMKSVEIHPSCIFVHQNVAEAAAGDKNMEGRRRLQQRLDEMARIAAQEDGREISGFDEIIQFDVEKQVFYFKNLLEGDPPMAPPNPTYSQNVQNLKLKLLTAATWQSDLKVSTLSKFSSRLQDLWKALLADNFVFSFRNTLEVMVYSQLESKYAVWTWTLRRRAIEIQNEWQNEIKSGKRTTADASELMKELDKVYKSLTSEIQTYFKEEKNADVLIKWKQSIIKQFEALRRDLIEEAMKQTKELLSIRKKRSDLDEQKCHYEQQLLAKSKDLASKLENQKVGEDTIAREFENLWRVWTATIARQQPQQNPVEVTGVIHNILLTHFSSKTSVQEKLDNIRKNIAAQRKAGKHNSSIQFCFIPKIHVSESFLKTVKKIWLRF